MIAQAIVALLQQASEIDRATVRSASLIARPPITSSPVLGDSSTHAEQPRHRAPQTLAAARAAREAGKKISQGRTAGTPRALRAVARCLVVTHTLAVLRGVGVTVR